MESLAVDLRAMVRTPLHDDHVRLMRRAGAPREIAAGDWPVRLGEPADTFFYLEEGELEAVEPVTGGRYGGATMGPGQFFGEITFLTGGPTMLPARAVQDSRVLAVPRAAMHELMSAVPEMSDIVVTVLAPAGGAGSSSRTRAR
jgi:thioredoxin reductase (NADPH)